jgi:hypothetical protein
VMIKTLTCSQPHHMKFQQAFNMKVLWCRTIYEGPVDNGKEKGHGD